MKKSNILYFIICLFCINIDVQSQSNFISAGQTFTNDFGSISLSMGGLFYQQISANNYTIEEGIQHGTIEIATQAKKMGTTKIGISPNPCQDYIHLNCNDINKSYTYFIYDITGKLQQKGQVLDKQMRIDINHLKPAIYYLNIRDKHRIVSNHKLIKQ